MKCPGQDMQYWNAEAIFEVGCPECGKSVEFYKDDTTRSCGHCGHRFVNPKLDFGCAAYCKFADQCIGTLPEEFVGSHDNLLKDKVAVEMKRHYKTDYKQIGFVSKVARHAEKIGRDEGAKLAIVLCAAYLKDIGSEDQDSAILASSILTRLGAKEEVLNEVCELLKIHAAGQTGNAEADTLADADHIARLEDQHKRQAISAEEFEQFISKKVLTESGKEIAQTTFRQLGVI